MVLNFCTTMIETMAHIALLLMVYLFQHVWGYRQNTYDLEHSHIAVDYRNNNHFKMLKLYNVKFNRTTRTFAADFTLATPVTDTVFLKIEAYMFLSNEYKKFPAYQLSMSFCKTIQNNVFGLKEALKDTNITFNCPIKTNSYYIHNIVVDSSKLPPGIPFGQYRMTYTFISGNDKWASISWYGAVIPSKKLKG